MKILCFSDLHAHPFKDFSKPDDVTGNTRLTDIVNCLYYMRDYALDNGITKVLDAGDIFHKRNNIDTTTYNAIFEAVKSFSDNGIEVIMIPGNHTQVDNSDMPESSIEPFSEIERVTVLKEFEPYPIKGAGVTVYPAPYSKNADMVKAHINDYVEAAKEKTTSILLAHLGVTHASVGKGSFTMEDAFEIDDLQPDVFDWVVLGHFHKRQDFGKFGHSNAFYVGNPIQHNFNDEGQKKGFIVIDTDKAESEFVEIPNKMFLTVTDLDELEKIDNIDNYYTRYQITEDDIEDFKEKVDEDSAHRVELTKDYETERRIDLDFSNSFSDMVKAYAQELENDDAVPVGLEIINEALSEVK